MELEHLRQTLQGILVSVAPECDLQTLADDSDLREELDLDSMDFLRFVTRIHEVLRVDVPEADYRQLTTLGGAQRYLESKLGKPTT